MSWTVVHDFAYDYGGAERVTEEFLRMLPAASLTCFAGSPDVLARMGAAARSRQLMPGIVTPENYRQLLPLHVVRATAARRLRGDVLCSSYGLAHFVRNEGRKVVYCHSPLRQAWSGLDTYSAQMPAPLKAVWRYVAAPSYRSLDRRHAARADLYIATSRAVRERLAQFYGKADVPIVAPPVDRAFHFDHTVARDDFYLWAGRIVEPYKRLGLLMEAFARSATARKLVVAGTGRDHARLAAIAPPNVHFVGEQTTHELALLYQRARALVMPSEDDFGMIATEAISSGTPVIAFAGGGALDTILEGISGLFFGGQTASSLLEALARFERTEWNPATIAAVGHGFSAERFAAQMRDLLGLRGPEISLANLPQQTDHVPDGRGAP